MSKRRKRGAMKGLLVTLAVVGTLGVAAGVTAIVTKGFKQWGPAEALVKGGTAVETFTAKTLSDGTLTLTNGKETEITLTSAFAGSLKLNAENEPEALYLGSGEGEATTTKAILESTLATYKTSNSAIEKIEKEVLALEKTKMSKMSLNLNVAYSAETAGESAVELPYFDTVRFNYKISNSRLVFIGSIGSGTNASYSYKKRINTITTLYDNFSLFTLGEGETVSENAIDFYSFSLKGGIDNKLEIKSIELVRSSNEHKGKSVWLTQ